MSYLSEIAFKPQRVFLIRHGQSTANVGATVGGPESPLTDQGRNEARVAGEILKSHNLNNPVIVVSPFTRTRQTAHHVMQALGKSMPDYVEPAVQERDFGPDWTGKDASKMQHEPDYFMAHPESTRRRKMRILNPNWRPSGGESLADVRHRAGSSIDSLIKKHPNQDIVVISHGHTIRALTAHFDNNWHSGRHVKNGEVKVFHVNHWGESTNDRYHKMDYEVENFFLLEGKKVKVYKELAQLLSKDEHSHWSVEHATNNFKLTSPLSDTPVLVSKTPKSRSTHKIQSDLRRAVNATKHARQAAAQQTQTSAADTLIQSKLNKRKRR